MTRNDQELNRLARGLALTEGFEFDIMVCDSEELVRRSLTRLVALVEVMRGEAVRLVSYASSLHTPSAFFEELFEPVQREPEHNHFLIHAIDAVGVSRDERFWLETFVRLNELRNTVIDHLGGPLLLVVTESLNRAFMQHAPDFWSIRTSTTFLKAPDASGPHHIVIGSSGGVYGADVTPKADAPLERLFNLTEDDLDVLRVGLGIPNGYLPRATPTQLAAALLEYCRVRGLEAEEKLYALLEDLPRGG